MSTANNKVKTGVILMTYGSATTAEHVSEYFERIYPGKASPELIADFENRYRLVGSSPLVAITQAQAELLQQRLGTDYIVRSAMRHSDPFINDAIAECAAAGAAHLVGIILSPQYSSFIMKGYRDAFEKAAITHGFDLEHCRIAEPWPTETHFIELLAERTKDSLEKLETLHGVRPPVVFTTHSLPERVVTDDPSYLDQLKATSDAVVTKLSDIPFEWFAAYQSAGHTPEKWLKPDLVDILKTVRKKRSPAVLIVPIQFLCDHLEILYDLDRAGAEQCAEHGIAYNRTALPNSDPLFINALASITIKTMNSLQTKRP